jgi:hypothetical protein
MEPMTARIGQLLLQKRIVSQTVLEKALKTQEQEPPARQRRFHQFC